MRTDRGPARRGEQRVGRLLRAARWGGGLRLLLFDDKVGTERAKAAGEVLVAAPHRMAHLKKGCPRCDQRGNDDRGRCADVPDRHVGRSQLAAALDTDDRPGGGDAGAESAQGAEVGGARGVDAFGDD